MIHSISQQHRVSRDERARKSLCPWNSAEEQAKWYLSRFLTQSPLTQAQRQGLFEQARAGNNDARERLVEAYLPVVARLATTYQDRGLDLPDLLQEGAAGVLQAIKSCKPSSTNAFHRYVTQNIRWKMHEAVRQNRRWCKLGS